MGKRIPAHWLTSRNFLAMLSGVVLMSGLFGGLTLMLFLSIAIVEDIIGSIDWQRTWETWEHASGTFENVATIIAFILGGTAAYLKFFRERINEDHLELKLSGKVVEARNARHLLVTVEAKNVGLKLFTIDHEGTGVRVGFLEADMSRPPDSTEAELTLQSHVVPYNWKYFRTLRVFEDQLTIEPTESLSDQQLAKLNNDQWPALRLELRVNSKDNTWFTAVVIPVSIQAESKGDGYEGFCC